MTTELDNSAVLTKQERSGSGKGVWILFLSCLALIPLSIGIGWFDNTTELTPTHPKVDQACFALAGLSGLLACGAGIYLTRRLAVRQRIVLPLVLLVEATIGVFLVTNHTAAIVEGWQDFPAGRTHTRQALIQISRAYKTHGKGASQYIQTMPVWSNLEISDEDFVFMQNHQPSGTKADDEITSRGFFCVKVTIEQSDEAVRILHAGSQKLPIATVIVCPSQPRMP